MRILFEKPTNEQKKYLKILQKFLLKFFWKNWKTLENFLENKKKYLLSVLNIKKKIILVKVLDGDLKINLSILLTRLLLKLLPRFLNVT